MSEKKELDFTGDEYWGKGGSYVVDPATGKRKPAPPAKEDPAPHLAPMQTGQRPDDAAPGEQIESQGLASAADADPANKLKEKRRA